MNWVGALAMILALFVFVMAHEAGHFIAAKAVGMKATEFFFGFGPRLFSFTRGDTEYGIKAIPAGGYVRIAGMNPFEEIAPEDVGKTYREKHFWEKTVVVLAGVFLNFLLAYLILWMVFAVWGNSRFEPTSMVGSIAEVEGITEVPALEAGILPGDILLAIDGVEYRTFDEFADAISALPGATVQIDLLRGAEEVTVVATLATRDVDGVTTGFLGVAPEYIEIAEEYTVIEAAGVAGQWTGIITREAYGFLWRLVQPQNLVQLAGAFIGNDVDADIRPVSIVGLAQAGSQADALGADNLLFLLAALNIVLGALNVLPLYPLDGGHFAVALYEKIVGREADIRRLVPVAAAVIALFVFLGLAAVTLDIVRPFNFSG